MIVFDTLEKDYEDQVVEFRVRTTNNGFDNFVSFFSERGVGVRRLNKFVQGRAKAVEYHSAANMINKRISDKVDTQHTPLSSPPSKPSATASTR